MHHERLVETRMLDGIAAVADVDERGLRERGEQLVRRMRREQGRSVLVGGRIAEHGMPAAVERVEPRVGVPGLVEVQAIDGVAADLDHAFDVVDQPVVGRIGDDRYAAASAGSRLRQRVCAAPWPARLPAAGLPDRSGR